MKTARQLTELSPDDMQFLRSLSERDGGYPCESEVIRRATAKFHSLWKLGIKLGSKVITVTTSEGPKEVDLAFRPTPYPPGGAKFRMEFRLEPRHKKDLMDLKEAGAATTVMELVRKSLKIYGDLLTWKELPQVELTSEYLHDTKVVVLIL